MFGVIEIIGFFLGSILLTPFADIIGRKKATLMLTLIQAIPVLVIAIVQQSSALTYGTALTFVFISGFATASKYNLAVLYAVEFTTKEKQISITFIAALLSGSGTIIVGAEYWALPSMLPWVWTYLFL